MVNAIPAKKDAGNAVYVAPAWKLTWWRFRKHKLAVFSLWVVDPDQRDRAARVLRGPGPVRHQRAARVHPAAAHPVPARGAARVAVRLRRRRPARPAHAADGLGRRPRTCATPCSSSCAATLPALRAHPHRPHLIGFAGAPQRGSPTCSAPTGSGATSGRGSPTAPASRCRSGWSPWPSARSWASCSAASRATSAGSSTTSSSG
jgi:hypothetical protein